MDEQAIAAPYRDFAAIRRATSAFGLQPADAADIAEAHAIATALIGPAIASPQALAAVHDATGVGVLVLRREGRLTGMVAMATLNEDGHAALLDERFDALAPQLDYLARPGDRVAALYGWGIAATDKASARDCVQSVFAVGQAVEGVRFYARAATDAGRRMLVDRMLFKPVPGSPSGLLAFSWAEHRAARAA